MMSYPVVHNNLPPVHPGRILRRQLDALKLSARKFADHIGVPPNAVTEILNGDRSVTALMAIRLGKAFGTTPQFWLNIQDDYDLKKANANLPADIETIQQLVAA
jgi:addiction module HigA family antidote